jgi:hypothetical protein
MQVIHGDEILSSSLATDGAWFKAMRSLDVGESLTLPWLHFWKSLRYARADYMIWMGGWVGGRVGGWAGARVRACACVCVCRYARADGIICFYRYARADWMMQHRGPRSLRYVDVAFRDDGRCNYLSNKALDSGTARHSHDSRAFDLSRIPRDLPGSQVEMRSGTHALLHTGQTTIIALGLVLL